MTADASMSSMFELYLSRKKLAEASIEIKSRAVKFFTDMFGDMPVSDVTYGHIEDYANWLTNDGRKNSTANTYLKNMEPFFKWMFSRSIIKANPFENLNFFKMDRPEGEIFGPDEIERILRIANPLWKALVILGLCGCRRGEASNIIVRDIRFDKSYVHIRPKTDTESTWAWSIKNHVERFVPLPKILKLSDDCEIDVHLLIMDLIDSNPAKQPYPFVQPYFYEANMRMLKDGKLNHHLRKCPNGRNFCRNFYGLLKRAKVQKKKFHDLRATFVTTMLKNKISLAETQKLVGHSTPVTTSRYYARFEKQELIGKSNEILQKCYVS